MTAENKRRVLVAEDNEKTLQSVISLMKSHGYEVDAVTCRRDAELLIKDQVPYVLIISDNQMPVRQKEMPRHNVGLELLRVYRLFSDVYDHTPFILNTSDDGFALIAEVRRLGGVYRHKNDGKSLRDVVTEVLSSQ